MTMWVWRHPPPQGVAGRCIGHTDVPVDPRKAKRLAHRIRSFQRKGLLAGVGAHVGIGVGLDTGEGGRLRSGTREAMRPGALPRVVLTSPLQRSASVGRWLKAWGWTHRIDARLCEMNFGTWDGQPWDAIGAAPVDTWCAAFAHHPAGGGESVAQLLARCEAFLAQPMQPIPPMPPGPPGPFPALCIVGHAGWISAALWLAQGHRHEPTASDWPRAVGYGTRVRLGSA